MRIQKSVEGLTVQAVGGSHVVLLGWDYPRQMCNGLAGFGLYRTDHERNEAFWLQGIKTFESTDPGLPPGSLHSTREHPIQSFTWSDYSARPGRAYTYRIVALKGDPADLSIVADTQVMVRTEAPEDDLNDVHFNRGVAASQEFARRFGDRRPEEIGQPAWDWLSRGLLEAMVGFVEAAEPGDELRVCAYEFRYGPFLEVLKQAVDRGVDLKVIYDAKKAFPGDENAAAAQAAGIAAHCIRRTSMKSAISHNKFVVRIANGKPVSVWTGGTNFSEGGIFGQSNVGEVAEHAAVAEKYAAYWELLATDPMNQELKPKVDALTPTPGGLPPKGTSVFFSPRGSLDLLDWYAARAREATGGLFMTFAFGMNDVFKEVYRNGKAPLRFALMEKEVRSMRSGPAKDAEIAAIRKLRSMDENLFAIGSFFRMNRFDTWLAERLTGLNSHVRFVHNKFMLIDPLSDDPIVVGGSANFSAASTEDNDENMLIVRGNKRVADIYLGEFMRLYSHHAFREFATRRGSVHPKLNHLRTDDWWKEYFGKSNRSRRRCYFAGIPFKP